MWVKFILSYSVLQQRKAEERKKIESRVESDGQKERQAGWDGLISVRFLSERHVPSVYDNKSLVNDHTECNFRLHYLKYTKVSKIKISLLKIHWVKKICKVSPRTPKSD